MNNTENNAAAYTPNPITGTVYEKDSHLFDTKKVIHSKDDGKSIAGLFRKLNYTVTGKKAFDSNGNHVGFKCSAKCRPQVAEGHNRRKKSWTEKLEHVEKNGHYEIWLDYKNLNEAYKEIFGEALEEYNSSQRKDRQIKNYLSHIIEDKRKGSMKKNSDVDNSRKPVYEFIFQIGKRDNRLDDETSILILKEFTTQWIPTHYPNIKPIGIYLHADEVTVDPVTKEKLPGAVHVHFDFVPIAHALTKAEQEEEKRWKKELEESAKKEAEENRTTFNKTKFDKQDWQLLRAQKFGKAIANGMALQSSMSGACCEMGFRTKGKLTAEIQMEEAIRQDLLDLCESYGIKVDREIEADRDKEVSINEYKKREDNKSILEETKRLHKETVAIQKENKKLQTKLENEQKNLSHERNQNQKIATQNRIDARENQIKQSEINSRERELNQKEEELARFEQEIQNIQKSREENHQRELSCSKKESFLQQKENELESRESELIKREKEISERTETLNTLRLQVYSQMNENRDKEIEIEEKQKALEKSKCELQKTIELSEKSANETRLLQENFRKIKADYEKYQLACEFVERTCMSLEIIEKEFERSLGYGKKSVQECVKDLLANVKRFVEGVVMKEAKEEVVEKGLEMKVERGGRMERGSFER